MTYGIGKRSEHGMNPNKGAGFTPYHHGKKVRRQRGIPLQDKPFIAWDGEGINLRGVGHPQSYVLFGNSTGSYIADPKGLNTIQCLEHIITTGQANPGAVHIGFAFSYDANMIVQSLSPTTLGRLHTNGSARIKLRSGIVYRVTFLKGKSFRVTKYLEKYDRKHNPTAKITVQIFDIFSFFMCSFEKAYKKMVGAVPRVITEGKKARGTFTVDDMAKIQKYWSLEIVLVRELAEQLRRYVYNAGLRISQWHGPGALSSYVMKRERIQDHMADNGEEIRKAARYAYAAGRFELYKVGRIVGRIYGIDKRSAYPSAIAHLPSFTDGGKWVHTIHPEKVTRFGVYRLNLSHFAPMAKHPGPIFHRDREHNISFPWHVKGWYWSPEAHLAQLRGGALLEGWEYRGSTIQPFSVVPEIYAQRMDWKRRNISAEYALKLLLNSWYGKLAQRVGWDEETGRKPPFHQLEWAGWVTSHTRASLYRLMMRIPFPELIAVETDGIYTLTHPDKLGITVGFGLGEWEVTEYTEMMYVQSGLAWLKDTDGVWHEKRRGLDPCREGHTPEECHCPATFSLNACREYLSRLEPGGSWPSYVGQTSRFVGLGQALSSARPMGQRHCVWETVPREITPGAKGKRVHMTNVCESCKIGATAYESAHDLVIRSRSSLEPESYPHSIPWEDELGHAKWRDYEELENEYVTSQYV